MKDAKTLLDTARAQGVKIVTAESCTGGMVASLITDIAGSSDVLDRGFVTYSNEAKTQMLGVDPALIHQHGAVSEPVAMAMAEGALTQSGAELSVSVTGIAGPGGGTEQKPVGLVHFATSLKGDKTLACHVIFTGDRASIRQQASQQALTLMLERLQSL